MIIQPPYVGSPTRPDDVTRNSIQINVIAVIDVAAALANASLETALMFVDNSVTRTGEPSPGRGTLALESQCNEGMVVNWIVYPVAPYGDPVPVSISKIEFKDPVLFKLQEYGAVDIAVSPDYIPGVTPSYSYWAGLVRPGVKPGLYYYRIEFSLGQMTLGISTPALDIWDIPPARTPPLRSGAEADGAAAAQLIIG